HRRRISGHTFTHLGEEQKNPAQSAGSVIPGNRNRSGDRRNSRRLGTLRALGDLIAHALTFLEAAKAIGSNRAVVDEYIRTAVLWGDEAKSLGIVEPLHCAVLHEFPPRLDT